MQISIFRFETCRVLEGGLIEMDLFPLKRNMLGVQIRISSAALLSVSVFFCRKIFW